MNTLEEERCTQTPPESVEFDCARFTGNPVARCTQCEFVCVYWECNCELFHDCDNTEGN